MRLFIFLNMMLSLISSPEHAAADYSGCPTRSTVEIDSSDAVSAEEICTAAATALMVLEGLGLEAKRQIRLRIIDTAIDHHGYIAYGTYDSRTDIIELMSYDSILVHNQAAVMYDEFFDRIHYHGAIAHEIAHAVFHHHSLNLSPGTAPQEYLAHAVQLASLPKERRRAIIARTRVSPWESGDAISDIYMALEPTRFAVKSYTHLAALAEPRTFIDILLNSKWFYVYIP
ncbi:MAG TPA: DUF6639 family protein [Desulfopila sp.]|nr:DUF6639 family protein [Desulfopila sp.]